MVKKILSIIVLSTMIFPTFLISPAMAEVINSSNTLATAVCSAEYQPVCGVDNVTYSNECVAEEQNDIDVSYEGKCHEVTNPNQKEEKSKIHFAGQLIEIGTTELPTNIIVRDNKTKEDYTINVTEDTILGQRRDQTTKLYNWIPGDQIRVIGEKNENTEVIDAKILINLSVKIKSNEGSNGWITKINKENQEVTFQWNNVEHIFKYNEDTRFVVGLKNPASVDDLKIGDRIRGRLLVRRGKTPLAKIVVVLRRGKNLFMKIRTFRPNATLVRLDSVILPTTIQVRIDKTLGIKANDVNNLIGTEGKLVTVNITEDTILTRRFLGRTTLDEFSVGDKLKIVGRVNNDGTIDAKLIKDNNIWRTSTKGHAGVVLGVDVNKNQLTMKWTPIKKLSRKKLKRKLKERKNKVSAQLAASNVKNRLISKISKTKLRKSLRDRIKQYVKKQVGRFLRTIKHKKVKIDRIKHHNIKIKDLIKRLPSRKIRVDITDNTEIVVGTNIDATLADIQVGDKIRVRGVKKKNLPIIIADKIVVVSSLPEIEDSLNTAIDDVNEVVSELDTDKDEDKITADTTSDTEEEISDDTEEATEDSNDTEKIESNTDNIETVTGTNEIENNTETNNETATSTEEIENNNTGATTN